MPTNIIESSQELSDKDFFCLIIILLQSLVICNYNLVTSTWVCSIRILSSVGVYYPAPLALLFLQVPCLMWRRVFEPREPCYDFDFSPLNRAWTITEVSCTGIDCFTLLLARHLADVSCYIGEAIRDVEQTSTGRDISGHDEIIKWANYQHHWPFVRAKP